MNMIQSVSVLCLMSAALTNAVSTLTASPSMTSVMAGPTVTAHSQFAPANMRSTVNVPAQWATSNMRLVTPPLSSSSHPQSWITQACKCEAPIVQDSAPESTPSMSRPIPRPCRTDTAVIVFHQHPKLLGPDTCVMTLYIDREGRRGCLIFEDLEWALEMALQKMQLAGYTRAALILEQCDSEDGEIEEMLTAAGYELQIESSSSEYLPKEVIWMNELPLPTGNVSAGAAFTPMMTVSGAVRHPDLPELFYFDPDTLSFGQKRLKKMNKGSNLIDLIDLKLKKFHYDHLSHAVVMIDAGCKGSQGYNMAISALQELDFQPIIPHPKQKLSFSKTELWLKKL